MYSIWICDQYGSKLFNADDFIRFAYTRVVNGIGRWSLTVPVRAEYYQGLALDSIIVARREVGSTGFVDLAGFVRLIQFDSTGGEPVFVLSGTDLNDLLRRRIVAYAAGTAQASKSGYADDVMKSIVRENLGEDAGEGRDLSGYGFRVQDDLSLGPQIERSFAWRNVLEVLQEISSATAAMDQGVYFDIVWVGPNTYEFRTYIGLRGVDRSGSNLMLSKQQVAIGEEFGNLEDPLYERDNTDEWNYVYAGGQGEGSNRLIVTVSDDWRISRSVWNRCETFRDARDCETEDGVRNAAMSELHAGRPRYRFTGRLVETSSCRYGVEWGLGDRVRVSLGGFSEVYAVIKSVSVEVNQNSETISADLELGQ